MINNEEPTVVKTREDLFEWSHEDGTRRSVRIEFDGREDTEDEEIWVYDYDLGVGEFIDELPGEITLYSDYDKYIENELSRLKAKYHRHKGGQ